MKMMMKDRSRFFFFWSSAFFFLIVSFFQIMFLMHLVGADVPDITIQRNIKGYGLEYDCEQCVNSKEQFYNKERKSGELDSYLLEEDIDIIATYTDAYGVVQISTVKSKDLSASWVWQNPDNKSHDQLYSDQAKDYLFQPGMKETEESSAPTDKYRAGEETVQYQEEAPTNPLRLKPTLTRKERSSKF